jgi:hypothetical protein
MFSYLTWPLFGLVVILGISYYISPNFEILSDKVWLTIFSSLFLFWTAPTIFLLVNHYKYFKGATFEYDEQNQEFYFVKDDKRIKFLKSDITMITQYNARTGRIPWSDIYIWEVKTKDLAITLAPIIISKSDFEKVFIGNPVEYKHEFFVSI